MSRTHSTPADPWTAERPRSTDPRLVAYVHGEPSRFGGVVVLSAALWGGHHERQVRLSVHEAGALGRELVALAEALEQRAFRERTRRRERAMARRARATAADRPGLGTFVSATSPVRPERSPGFDE